MKKFFYTLVVVLCTGLMAACSGNTDDTTIGSEWGKDGKLHIKADKTTLQANGADKVTFTIVYDGEDISDARTVSLMVTDEAGEETKLKDGSNVFSTRTAGTYSIRANYYKGGNITSDEAVKVTATEVGGTKYKHVVLGMDFTSEGCKYCPGFAKSVEEVWEKNSDKMVLMALHVMKFNNVTDFLGIPEAQTYLQNVFNAPSGLPQFYYNLRKTKKFSPDKEYVEAELENELKLYPPTCGVAIDSKFDASTRRVDITAKITSDVENEYRYIIYLVEDKIKSRVQDGASKDYVHRHVVRKVLSSSTLGERFPAEYRPIPANQEVSVSTDYTIPADWKVEDMSIVVSMLSSLDGGESYTSNNTAQCKLGESVDYAYND